MPGVGSYDVEYTLILRDKLSAQLAHANSMVGKFGNQLGGALNGISAMINPATLAIAGLGKAAQVAITEAMNFQSTQAELEVLTGSLEEAKNIMSTTEAFAISTPYGSRDLNDTVKTLLQFGVANNKALDTMKLLGNVAMGDAFKLQRLTLAYGQMSSAGRLMGQDLLQMINAGFNPLVEISKRTGKTTSELRKEMERGNITVAMVEQAFKDATSEGGRFNGMMEKQAETMKGQWGAAVEQTEVRLRNLGLQVLPAATLALKGFNDVMSGENIGGGYLDWMKGLTQTINPIGWAWAFVEKKIDKHHQKLNEVIPTYTSLEDQLKMIASSSLPQLEMGLSNNNQLIETAARLTETQLVTALDNAQRMYGITSAQIDVFMGKVREQQGLFNESTRKKTIGERTTEDLENQIKAFKDMQDKLTGSNKDMEERKRLQKEINQVQKEVDRREGVKSRTSGGGRSSAGGGEGTTISSRAPQYYTINIDQLVGAIYTKKETLNESDADTKRKVTEVLVGALNDTQLIAANK